MTNTAPAVTETKTTKAIVGGAITAVASGLAAAEIAVVGGFDPSDWLAIASAVVATLISYFGIRQTTNAPKA